MGRTATKRKRKQRIKEIEEEHHDAVIAQREERTLDNKSDTDLFVVDRKGATLSAASGALVPAAEEEAEKAATTFEAITAPRRAASSKDRALRRRKKKGGSSALAIADKRSGGAGGESYDLWGDAAVAAPVPALVAGASNPIVKAKDSEAVALAVAAKTGSKRRRQAVKSTPYQVSAVTVAVPGASYNPSKADHSDAIAHAVAEETAHQEEIAKAAAWPEPVSEELTLDIDKSDGDDDDHEGGDEEGGGGGDEGVTRRALVDRSKKKTRADKNRAKAHRARLEAAREAKEEKAMLAEIEQAGKITKELSRTERDEAGRRAQLKAVKEAEYATGVPTAKRGKRRVEDMSHLEVPLTEELTGSMRQTKTVGSVVSDRFNSMLQRNLFERGAAQGRKKTKVKRINVYKNRLK